MNTAPIRYVARVVVVDDAGHVLLVRYCDARDGIAGSYWVPPGGALEPGETHRAAAQRELREETGIVAEVHRELFRRSWQMQSDRAITHQHERYFLVRLDVRTPPVHNCSTEAIDTYRWWPLESLRQTDETVYPDGLVAEVESALAVD